MLGEYLGKYLGEYGCGRWLPSKGRRGASAAFPFSELSSQENEEHTDVARGNSRDASGLGQRFGIDGRELLSRFGGELCDGIVIEAAADADGFEALHLVGKERKSATYTVTIDHPVG